MTLRALTVLALAGALTGCLVELEVGRNAGDDAAAMATAPDAAVPPVAGATILATGPAGAYEVVADDTHLYWIVVGQDAPSARVLRVEKTGGGAQELLELPPRLYGLAMDDTHLYLSNYSSGGDDGSILRLPKGSAGEEVFGGEEVLVADLHKPTAIAVDAEYVYWGSATPDGAIRRVPKLGGLVAEIAAPVNSPSDLAVDGDYVYYTESNLGRVMRVRCDGTAAPEVLAAGWIWTEAIALDAQNVYFTAPPRLYSLPRAGGDQVFLAAVPNDGTIAVGGDYVFVAGPRSAGMVHSRGGDYIVLAGDRPGPRGVAAEPDGSRMYWADFVSGEIGTATPGEP